MKKIMSILLVLLLVMAILPTAALADGPAVVLSNQNLRVDGKRIQCEKYNIDGSNYFKLRDLAYVLNGTGSQFSVSWDGANKCISIVTGESYEPNGTELDLSFGDKSATAIPSADKLLINGVDRSDLSAYKFEGNNFYKLRELGDALGFFVDYDKPSNTMIVISHAWSWPTEWLTVETIYNDNGAAVSHQVYTYDEDGREQTGLYESEYGKETESYTYDDLGRQVSYTSYTSNNYDGEIYESYSSCTYEYDMWGLLIKTVYESTGDYIYETVYTYDDDGNLTVQETTDNGGRSGYYYTYDENGNVIKTVYTYDDEVISTTEYTVDADGNTLSVKEIGADGTVNTDTESVYENGLLMENNYSSGDYVSSTRYTYDENGNRTRIETQDNYGTYVTSSIYDEQGRLVQEEYNNGDFSYLAVYTYDERGFMTKSEVNYSDGSYYLDETTYDEDGNILSDVYSGEGFTRTDTYTYDKAAQKLTVLCVYEVVGVG